MLNSEFIHRLEQICSQIENKPVKLRAYETIYGGDINRAYRLAMTDTDYFIKLNTLDKIDMFEKEALSLNILSATNSFRIPKVFAVESFENNGFLLMEFIEKANAVSKPEKFAENLAKLHRNTQKQYGLEFDNYIGALPQFNQLSSNWIDFFINKRLKVQIKPAEDKKLIPEKMIRKFNLLFEKLPQILPVEKPALIHGDLWSGNYFYDSSGKAVIFDPAIYYGNREMDMAMMSLFGGFASEIYIHYNTLFPLQPAWKERIKIYQLYPLLVHLNLFGSNYLSSINNVLDTFV